MSDNLRDRIAAVQSSHMAYDWGCRCGWEYDPLIDDSHFDHVADSVIEALDLGTPCATTGCRMRKIARRSAEKLGLTGSTRSRQPRTPPSSPSG